MNENELDALCPELKLILEHELKNGNRILAVESAWSRVKLAVRLAAPLDVPYIQQTIRNNPDFRIWESRDIKNPPERGVLCRSAKQTVSGRLGTTV